MTRATALALSSLLVFSACRRSETGNLIEAARTRVGNIDVVVLAEDGALNHGRDAVTLEFRHITDGSLADVGTVKANATMPMASMAPMLGGVEVLPGDAPGRYTATIDLSMAGGWRLGVEWNGPAGRGSATLLTSVR